MDIATINDFLFPVQLFLLFFYLFSQLFPPQRQAGHKTLKPNPTTSTKQTQNPLPAVKETSTESIPLVQPQKPEAKILDTVTTPIDSTDSAVKVLELETLRLPQAKKIAKYLGIKQSVKGKAKRVKQLRAEIQQHLEQNPSLVPNVIIHLADLQQQQTTDANPQPIQGTAKPKTTKPAKTRSHTQQSTSISSSEAINLDTVIPDTLTFRKARKVAKALGIRQKVKGKDKPLKFLRAEIKQKLESQSSNPTLKQPSIPTERQAA